MTRTREDCREGILGFESWLLGQVELPEWCRFSSREDVTKTIFCVPIASWCSLVIYKVAEVEIL